MSNVRPDPSPASFVKAAGGGDDYGTGRYTVDILGIQSGSVRDMNGSGGEIGFNDGIGGLSLSIDKTNNINGVAIHLGPGFNVGGAGTVTKAWTFRDMIEDLRTWIID